jgi:hypothetical protein
MEPEGSLPHSQVPATRPYPEPARSIPYPTSYLLKIHLNVILPSTLGSPPTVSPPKPCIRLSTPPYEARQHWPTNKHRLTPLQRNAGCLYRELQAETGTVQSVLQKTDDSQIKSTATIHLRPSYSRSIHRTVLPSGTSLTAVFVSSVEDNCTHLLTRINNAYDLNPLTESK